MYIVKNALKCIGRSKGRNILIGVIVLVIAISACLGLSIRQAAESAKKETLDTLSVTGTISFDRQSMMSGMTSGGSFDRDSFASMMGSSSSLSLEEYQSYAEADSVQDFYYSVSASLNGTENFEPVSSDTADEESSSEDSGFGSMMGGMMGMQGDFSIVGYSGESAMTSFLDGTASIIDGSVFEEGTEGYDCIISEELSVFNNLAVGDTVQVANPSSEDEVYELNIVGIYSDSSSNESSFSMLGAASDPANKIYMSYTALQSIIDASAEVAVTETDEETGLETSTAVRGTLTGTYVFADTEAYYQFEEDVRDMGLDDSFAVSSPDLAAYENSLMPLDTLSSMATTFLIVILVIGAVILVVLNIFNVRERKYEIGVLTAMGMKKGKVALQFLTEIFAVTITSVMIGVGVGAVSSVPVTNALLENQVVSQQNEAAQVEENFGRGDMSGFTGGAGGGSPFGGNSETSYVTEISSAMNMTVVWQMLGIAVILTMAAGAASVLFVMRYEPLKILANRD